MGRQYGEKFEEVEDTTTMGHKAFCVNASMTSRAFGKRQGAMAMGYGHMGYSNK